MSTTDIDSTQRPLVHFTPRRNWMNDPNGLVWHAGEYHLFFQYNPEGATWGNMSWGHAVSTDLVTWTELPVALAYSEEEFVFSGSVVVDHRDTSGLGEPGRPAMVALYTAHDPASGHQAQALAWSVDRGRTWTRSPANPVLDIGATAFRDPKVFWYEPGSYWVMAVALAEDQIIRLYRSADLHSWEQLSDFSCPGPAGLWECADLFELPIEGDAAARRWVLVFSLDGKDTHGWSGTQYVVGSFDGITFLPDVPGHEALRVDHGADFYAAVSYSDAPGDQRILLGWMNNWAYAERTPAVGSRGAMAFPRVLSLTRVDGEIRLRQRLVDIAPPPTPVYEVTGVRVPPGTTAVEGCHGGAQLIRLTMEPGSAHAAGIHVRVGTLERTVIGYDTEERLVYVDRRSSGDSGFNPRFAAVHRAPVELGPEGRLELTVLVDRCSVEVFAQDGSVALTDLVFPSDAATGIELFAEGGEAVMDLLSVAALPLDPPVNP